MEELVVEVDIGVEVLEEIDEVDAIEEVEVDDEDEGVVTTEDVVVVDLPDSVNAAPAAATMITTITTTTITARLIPDLPLSFVICKDTELRLLPSRRCLFQYFQRIYARIVIRKSVV
jgi:hypothetical protein